MDWIDRIDNIKFEIVTGDAVSYFPLFKSQDSEKSVEYNTSTFEFINVYGTLVDRKKPKSGKFPLTFFFEGADNIDQSEKFERSCDDSRAWVLIHPFYGRIVGQPISISRKDNFLNVTEFAVDFYESIEVDYPLKNFSIKDNTRELQKSVFSASANSYANTKKFTSLDIAKNKTSIQDIASDMNKLQDNSTYTDFQNAMSTAMKAMDSLDQNPLEAIASIQRLLELPNRYLTSVQSRIAGYENTFNRLKLSIDSLTDKKYYESVGATIIAAISVVVVNPLFSDYVTVSALQNISLRLRTIFAEYTQTVDSLAVSLYDVNNTFNADPIVKSSLNQLVNFTLANLFTLSFGSKRERIIYTTKKTNAILLVHQYLGLDDDDKHLEDFIALNNIRLKELFSIQKGREIRYLK